MTGVGTAHVAAKEWIGVQNRFALWMLVFCWLPSLSDRVVGRISNRMPGLNDPAGT
jgi:hypothetical protein